jgi:predicted metalloprotease
VWTQLFAQAGQRYQPPTLRFFEQSVQSGCGAAQSAMGPFYCPSDQRIYIDLTFFDDLSKKFGARGDFAGAYVIAHEAGHHIQTISGTSNAIRRAQSGASERESNALQVRMELQADCLAGVWAANVNRSGRYAAKVGGPAAGARKLHPRHLGPAQGSARTGFPRRHLRELRHLHPRHLTLLLLAAPPG